MSRQRIKGPIITRKDVIRIEATMSRLTDGQRWRLRRNLVIWIAYQQGASHRLLADVFDLAKSRISKILDDLKAMYDEDPSSVETQSDS